jgi:hypothetical protein
MAIPRIDIITKMHRALATKSSNVDHPTTGATVYRIDRVAHADRVRIIYGVEVPRYVEISRMQLETDFPNTMYQLNNLIQQDAIQLQNGKLQQVLPKTLQREDIEFEVSL